MTCKACTRLLAPGTVRAQASSAMCRWTLQVAMLCRQSWLIFVAGSGLMADARVGPVRYWCVRRAGRAGQWRGHSPVRRLNGEQPMDGLSHNVGTATAGGSWAGPSGASVCCARSGRPFTWHTPGADSPM